METSMNTQPSSTPPPGVVFDTNPVPASSTPPPGITFDTTPVPSTAPAPEPTATQTTPESDELRIAPNDSIPMSIAKGAGGFLEGMGEGVFGTAAGASDLADKFTGAQPGSVNRYLHHEAGDDNASHGLPQLFGQGGESLMEFLAGDGALKGLALSDKLLQSAKVAKALESSPLLSKAVHIGINALRAGAVQGTDTYVRTGGNTGQAAGQGAFAGTLTGILGAGGETINAIRTALDDSGVQPALQTGIRNILSDAATKAGVSTPTATSIRDAAQQIADGLKAKAQGMYQTLDQISGGQAQRFRDAAQNVSDQLRSIVGLDDEREAELLAKQAKIEAAHKDMLDKLAAQGHDPNLLAKADAVWKQQSALSDLSNSIRQSTTGLRPELAKTATGATTQEAVNLRALFAKVNRLNDRGRLAQAIGQDNANALMQHVDAAYVQAQKFAERQKWAATLAKAGLSATGLGVVGAGYGLVKHVFGGQ